MAEENGEIIGYIIADHKDKYIDDEYKTWFDLNAKELYYNSPHAMAVATLAVKPKSSKKGLLQVY